MFWILFDRLSVNIVKHNIVVVDDNVFGMFYAGLKYVFIKVYMIVIK